MNEHTNEAVELDEYLRRNLLHAASVGAAANAQAALARLERSKRPPRWLLEALRGIYDRASRVASEMAKHRDEVKP